MTDREWDAAPFLKALQRGVRTMAGRSLTPVLRRWRHTQSREDTALVLRPETAVFLCRYGLLDAGQDPGEQQRLFEELLQRLARASGDARGVIAAWLDAFAGGGYGLAAEGICGPQPKCGHCPLRRGCRYLTAGAREERLFGEALSKTLAQPAKEQPGARAAELLAFLTGSGRMGAGAVARAESVLQEAGGVRGALGRSAAELRRLGLSEQEAARIRAASELFDLWSREVPSSGRPFARGQDFFDRYHLRLRDLKKERFIVICLDQKHRWLGDESVSEGSLTEALVHPREVFLPAIRAHAAAIAVIHNHPSGDPTPSRQDQALTQRLRDAAELIGIRLLDHVVIGDGRYVSFVEKGLL